MEKEHVFQCSQKQSIIVCLHIKSVTFFSLVYVWWNAVRISLSPFGVGNYEAAWTMA